MKVRIYPSGKKGIECSWKEWREYQNKLPPSKGIILSKNKQVKTK